jgi:hypothetical protein
MRMTKVFLGTGLLGVVQLSNTKCCSACAERQFGSSNTGSACHQGARGEDRSLLGLL